MKEHSRLGFANLVLIDDLKAEWEGLPEDLKKDVMNKLTHYTSEMTLRASIDTLSCIVCELHERIKKLETK